VTSVSDYNQGRGPGLEVNALTLCAVSGKERAESEGSWGAATKHTWSQ